MRKERVRWYQQSADFVGVLRVMFSRLCGRVGVCAGKNSFERDYLNCLPRGVWSYALMSLYVLLKIWLCKCLFLTLMRLYCMSRMSNQLFQKRSERYDIWERWMKLFHCCIHITKRERERGTHASCEYAHQRATRAAARNKRYRFARERERERE